MKEFRYLENVTTLTLDKDVCIGCGMCEVVCPHTVFEVIDKKADIRDLDGCMECGACVLNCSEGALSVSPGVGCATAILIGWILRKQPGCGRETAR